MTPAQIEEMEDLAAEYAATDANLYEPRYVLEEKTKRKAFAYVDGYTAAMKKSEVLETRIEGMILALKQHGQNIDAEFNINWLQGALKQWRGK